MYKLSRVETWYIGLFRWNLLKTNTYSWNGKHSITIFIHGMVSESMKVKYELQKKKEKKVHYIPYAYAEYIISHMLILVKFFLSLHMTIFVFNLLWDSEDGTHFLVLFVMINSSKECKGCWICSVFVFGSLISEVLLMMTCHWDFLKSNYLYVILCWLLSILVDCSPAGKLILQFFWEQIVNGVGLSSFVCLVT